MNKIFCDECGRECDGNFVYIKTKKKYRANIDIETTAGMHSWNPTDLCDKCTFKILREIATKIMEEKI